jgi:hypothetical protein
VDGLAIAVRQIDLRMCPAHALAVSR